MKATFECQKRLYEATAYGLKYKTYGDADETVVIHLNKKQVKSQEIPDKIRITVEWEEAGP